MFDRVNWRYWLHLDVDVLHQHVMSAINSPGRSGLEMGEVVIILHSLLSPQCAGLALMILDPGLDPDGKYTRKLVQLVVYAWSAVL
ncbi:arginase family protein [Microvirga pakistanensis]|uniref:arginase family protein n=1 Tax=Microvirga pakistanensis TaxID=1682650 RepID=UPI001068F771